jgi:hypothetical protein
MRIDSAGNVGIGTTSPSAPLDVVSDGSAIGLRVRGRAADNFGLIQFGSNNAASDYAYIGSPSANQIAIYTNGFTERMRIDSAGNVGIGTSSPAFKLETMGEIKSSISDGDKTGITIGRVNTSRPKLEFNVGDNSARFKFEVNGANTSNERLGFFAGPIGSAATIEAMTLSGSGNVGIGTTSPSAKLDVAGDIVASNLKTSANTALSLGLSAGTAFNTGGSAISLRGSTTGYNDSGMEFYAGNSERMRIDSAGNVGIGTTSPSQKLDVAGSILASGNVTAYSDIRVKDNVESIEGAIGKLNQIRGVTYTRTDLDDKQRRFAGVIAQEIEQVLPEAVFDNGKVKAVDYNATIALLIEAVKEQQKRIDKLETLLNKGN